MSATLTKPKQYAIQAEISGFYYTKEKVFSHDKNEALIFDDFNEAVHQLTLLTVFCKVVEV